MEIQFKARNAKISEEFKGVVSQKLIRMERFGVLLERVQVEISHESNPRHGKGSHKVQLTTHGAGRWLERKQPAWMMLLLLI